MVNDTYRVIRDLCSWCCYLFSIALYHKVNAFQAVLLLNRNTKPIFFQSMMRRQKFTPKIFLKKMHRMMIMVCLFVWFFFIKIEIISLCCRRKRVPWIATKTGKKLKLFVVFHLFSRFFFSFHVLSV